MTIASAERRLAPRGELPRVKPGFSRSRAPSGSEVDHVDAVGHRGRLHEDPLRRAGDGDRQRVVDPTAAQLVGLDHAGEQRQAGAARADRAEGSSSPAR